jgi:hypothetical protein
MQVTLISVENQWIVVKTVVVERDNGECGGVDQPYQQLHKVPSGLGWLHLQPS